MEKRGVLANIRKRHYPSTIKNCNESRVALGYNQLGFPIIVLILGIVFSVILGCLETAFHKIFQNVIGGRVTAPLPQRQVNPNIVSESWK